MGVACMHSWIDRPILWSPCSCDVAAAACRQGRQLRGGGGGGERQLGLLCVWSKAPWPALHHHLQCTFCCCVLHCEGVVIGAESGEACFRCAGAAAAAGRPTTVTARQLDRSWRSCSPIFCSQYVKTADNRGSSTALTPDQGPDQRLKACCERCKCDFKRQHHASG
jgi:hypothetical protein